MPDWQETHAPDLGVALVELLAYAGDYLSYYQDAVATEAYLGTARQRISVRRHARLVDYRMHEGCNARALGDDQGRYRMGTLILSRSLSTPNRFTSSRVFQARRTATCPSALGAPECPIRQL